MLNKRRLYLTKQRLAVSLLIVIAPAHRVFVFGPPPLLGEAQPHSLPPQGNRRIGEQAKMRTGEQANRQTGKQANTQTSEQAHSPPLLWANRRTGEQVSRRTGEQANRRAGDQANRRTGKQANRRTGEPANRETGDQADRTAGRANRRTGKPAISRSDAMYSNEYTFSILCQCTTQCCQNCGPLYVQNPKSAADVAWQMSGATLTRAIGACHSGPVSEVSRRAFCHACARRSRGRPLCICSATGTTHE